MTKIFYGLPIWLVQTEPVNIEVVINQNSVATAKWLLILLVSNS